MSDIIRLLPDSVANQIAAGEVIQRPASVIKELVENAVDAGATDIRVVVKDAGKTMIQVIDNGCGMSETDARMAFERHATSKIRKADDLFALHTCGFRGEALPSICAISEVEIKTRTADSPMGTRLVIMGSKVQTQEPCVCEKGTVFTVRKIFYNVPARRKFLKSDSVELSNIMREFERLALVNNRLRMQIDNGSKVLDLRAASMRLRIEDIWKNSLKSDHLIPVDVDTSLVKIEGFVSRPEFARRRNPLQYLIVNGRNFRHPYFHKAIVSCYQNLIASDTMPCYFIKFTVDPGSIDVNIHPTKNDIKFEYEQQIWPILVSAIKTALGKFSAVPSIDFTAESIQLDPLKQGETAAPPHVGFDNSYNPFSSASRSAHAPKVDSNWERLYENFRKSSTHGSSQDSSQVTSRNFESSDKDASSQTESIFGDTQSSDVAAICIQFALKYIVTSTRDGLLLIDQHRAHLKILYEEYISRLKRMEIVSQSVMFPEVMTLDESQQSALLGIMDGLNKLGFTLDHEGDRTWRISSVPTILGNGDSRDVILRIIDSELEDSVNYGKEGSIESDLYSRASLVMARSAAIRRGVKLSEKEMEHIVSGLFSLPDPSLTPNGNPIYYTLDEQQVSGLLQ